MPSAAFRKKMALTALKVARLSKPGRYGDGNGLWLQISKWGTKAWLYRYQLAGKARAMGLGSAETVSLSTARDLRDEARRQVRDGIDPIAARKAAKGGAGAGRCVSHDLQAGGDVDHRREGRPSGPTMSIGGRRRSSSPRSASLPGPAASGPRSILCGRWWPEDVTSAGARSCS